MSNENKNKVFYDFNHSEDELVIIKTAEVKGDISKWFRVDDKKRSRKQESVEGDITEFICDGRKGSMPTKMFEKNFTKVEVVDK